jgi:hypothetical protein
MTTSRSIEWTLWITTVVLVMLSATWRDRQEALGTPSVGAAHPAASETMSDLTPDQLADAVGDITDGNLFRLERQSAPAIAAPAPLPSGMPPAFPPRPRLLLRGILGGPPWDAVIEGIPGREGSVVARAGDKIAGLLIRSVHRDTVVVRGTDTTWRLTMERP